MKEFLRAQCIFIVNIFVNKINSKSIKVAHNESFSHKIEKSYECCMSLF